MDNTEMKDTEMKAADMSIRRICEIIKEDPEAQFMLVFKGRSLPATFSEYYEETAEGGFKYMVLNFWDGDSGNLFDLDYRLVPEKLFVNGKLRDFS